jgi:hypothetical protein
MIFSEKDKEKLVVDLLNKGHTAREIAKQAHLSFTDIKKIQMKITGDVDGGDKEKKKPLSIPSQAFKLFLEGKSIVQVAIWLDLHTDQALKIHSDYLTLRNMGMASQKIMENRRNLVAYLKLFDYLEGNKVKAEDMNYALDLARNINNLKSEKAQLEFDIDMLMDTKTWYVTELAEIKNKYCNSLVQLTRQFLL